MESRRREFQVATLVTNKSHDDIMVLASIEGWSSPPQR
jgi:hypothetical protein